MPVRTINLYMLFIPDIESTIEKIVCMWGGRGGKVSFTETHKINVCHLDIQKHVCYEKWFKYYILFAYRFIQKFSNTLRPMEVIFKAYFSKLILHQM